jgi:hypothetical protein
VKIYAPKEGFGIYGSSLPSSFYRKDENLTPEMRYYGGAPPQIMKFGAAWRGANFELIDKTTEIAPGMTLIALVSDAPGTKELKELSLAINTSEGIVLVVGCSHPGIEKIVEAAAAINPKIYLIAGGFHLVAASDDVIAKAVAALKDTFKVESIAPGHCTGEPTFAALKKAFGDRYLYAGSALPFRLARTPGPTCDAVRDRRCSKMISPPIVGSRATKIRSASYRREAYGQKLRNCEDARRRDLSCSKASPPQGISNGRVGTIELRDRDLPQVISSTLKASIGRCKPLSVSSPTGSAVALPSRAARTLSSIKIWPSRASAQRRAARLTTVPIAL